MDCCWAETGYREELGTRKTQGMDLFIFLLFFLLFFNFFTSFPVNWQFAESYSAFSNSKF